MRLRQSLLMLPVAAAAAFGTAAGAEMQPSLERMHGGVRLFALAPDAGARFDVSVPAPEAALERIAEALDLIRQWSPASAAAVGRLEASGRVTLIYYPNEFRDRNRPNAQTVALFLPEFLKSRGLGAEGLEFTVVINQFGVKWPAGELATVIVHELAGHGIQHLQGRIASARVLDLECEASLYQEQAYQDLGIAKKARTAVLFRRQMEYRYCADFRAYMLKRAPGGLALWGSLNPDVATLLDLFGDYRRAHAAQKDRAARPVSSRSR